MFVFSYASPKTVLCFEYVSLHIQPHHSIPKTNLSTKKVSAFSRKITEKKKTPRRADEPRDGVAVKSGVSVTSKTKPLRDFVKVTSGEFRRTAGNRLAVGTGGKKGMVCKMSAQFGAVQTFVLQPLLCIIRFNPAVCGFFGGFYRAVDPAHKQYTRVPKTQR